MLMVLMIQGCSDDGINEFEGPGLGGVLPTPEEIFAVPVVDTTELYDGRAAYPGVFSLNMPT
jgi:hypothetical protein